VRLAGQILLAVAIGMPVGAVLAMLSTPLLWKLEGLLGAELAGHSGPSEWILGLSGAFCAAMLLYYLRRNGAKMRSRDL
jgi:hypothetical protein